MNILKFNCTVTICVLSCLASPKAWAQLPNAHAYEEGVNAYFAGRTCQAEGLLSQAMAFDSQDPRAYYFRAFSLLRQGRMDEARGDMLTGAILEAQQPHRFAIGSALERVQGPSRLMLEEYRRNARLNAAVANQSSSGANASNPNQTYRPGESNVLREKSVVPLEELLRPGGPHTIADEPADETPPLPPQGATSPANSAEPPAAKAVEQPAARPVPAVPNPFEDETESPPPKAAPAPKIPPQEAPKPTPPASPDENPFG